jgi:hypothetical protein
LILSGPTARFEDGAQTPENDLNLRHLTGSGFTPFAFGQFCDILLKKV